MSASGDASARIEAGARGSKQYDMIGIDESNSSRGENRNGDGDGSPCMSTISGCWSSFTVWWSLNGPIRQSDGDAEQLYINGWFWFWFFAGATILISCVASSYHYVNYNQYGLKRNNYGSIYLKPTLEEGRYFYSLNYGVVYFPSTFQPIDFESSVFADNGMEFDLHVRFYYRLPKLKVGDIYDKFSKNYESRIENNGKNVIKNVGTKFKVHDYLSNRSYVEHIIAGNITSDLEKAYGVEVPMSYVKIVGITFPSGLISTSLDSALALQRNELQLLQQDVDLVEATTNQMVATIDAGASLLLQNTDNKCQQIIGTANQKATSLINTARTTFMSKMFDQLNITSLSDKENLIKAMALYDSQAVTSTLMYDVSGGALVNV